MLLRFIFLPHTFTDVAKSVYGWPFMSRVTSYVPQVGLQILLKIIDIVVASVGRVGKVSWVTYAVMEGNFTVCVIEVNESKFTVCF